ncbi:MAG TPA: glycogen synthase GlgA [Kofleriaceae bacterium]|nr:glycogen synthase GlgA [Kofleriaceae bacterium]
MRVLHVTSEAAPFAQSGGLADVLGGLPPALAHAGFDVAVLLPLYRGTEAKIAAAGATLDAGTPITIELGPHTYAARLRTTRFRDVIFGFIDAPLLYDRAGLFYGPTGNSDYGDNYIRFGALGKVAVDHGASLLGGAVDVLHAHDWQGSPAATYARTEGMSAAIVTTIHNLAYRGVFPKHVMTDLGHPWSLFTIHNLEFYDQVSFLKGGMANADAVTTVSPSYAKEILTPQFGEALDGFLQHDVKRLVGIANGIDTEEWDPATDRALPASYSVDALAGKAVCRRALAHELGLTLADDEPLIAVIARMTGQKGLDLVKDAVPELHRLGAKLVVLGSGEPDLEATFTWLANAFKDQIAVRIGFDIALSRRIYAGSDLFLMPSRFEPCGLGQLYAMRYGSIPVVHAVGGLRDTVTDPDTGIQFSAATVPALLDGLERAMKLFRDPKQLAATRRAAMLRDSSWTASAQQYAALYRSLR